MSKRWLSKFATPPPLLNYLNDEILRNLEKGLSVGRIKHFFRLNSLEPVAECLVLSRYLREAPPAARLLARKHFSFRRLLIAGVARERDRLSVNARLKLFRRNFFRLFEQDGNVAWRDERTMQWLMAKTFVPISVAPNASNRMKHFFARRAHSLWLLVAVLRWSSQRAKLNICLVYTFSIKFSEKI